jgi:glycosyltransferase, family 1
MLAGVPVIASDAGANKELIDNGNTGVFYELGDVQGLADKIEELISDKEYRQKLSLNAYNVAVNNYTAQNNAQKVLEVYNKVWDNEPNR